MSVRTFVGTRGTHARLAPARALRLAGFLPVFLFLQGCHWIGFALDEVFFRGYRRIEVNKPLFIVGVPRSGTTFFHRLLNKDTQNFTSVKLWELVFAPSIAERRFWMAVRRLDKRLGGWGRALVTAVENRVFEDFRAIHRLNLFEPEEDDIFLVPAFGTIFLMVPFPFPEELWHLGAFDEATPRPEKHRIMTFYKRCVQKHLYVHGPDKHFLSKNPAFSPKVDALNECFPDCRVVCSVRTPYEVVPSLLSLLMFAWERMANDPKDNEFRDRVINLIRHWYRHPAEQLPAWPDDRHMFLLYDELVADPKNSVERLYARFGMTIGPSFAETLRNEHERAGKYKSKHSYSLDQYELTIEQVNEFYHDVFERYGFEMHGPTAPGQSGKPPAIHDYHPTVK